MRGPGFAPGSDRRPERALRTRDTDPSRTADIRRVVEAR